MEVDVGANDDTGEDQSDTDISGNLTPCLLTATHMAVMAATTNKSHVILFVTSSFCVNFRNKFNSTLIGRQIPD